VGALILDEDLILLVERGREPLIGLWSLPGGAVETGETLDAAVRREILEETGLEVEPIRVFEIFERIMRDAEGRPEYHYVLIDYICRVSGGTLAPADDVRRAEWISQRNLENYNLTEGTLDVIERAFGTHAGHQR
jgi:ADP-ribose pyrophosphatase YjhB (NUDIX family)